MTKKPKYATNDGMAARAREKGAKRRKKLAEAAAATAEPEAENPPHIRNDLLPKLKLEHLPIAKLIPARRRTRRVRPEQIARLKRSIQRFGMICAILIDATNTIIDGHQLVLAALELGLEEVPCIRIEHLSDTELRLLQITINRLQEMGDWDEDVLQLELKELQLLGEDLTVTGFDTAVIDILGADDPAEVEGAFDDVSPAERVAVSKLGDVWLMEAHRLGCADARDGLFLQGLLDGEGVRLAIIDPPYNLALESFSSRDHADFPMGFGEMEDGEFLGFLAESHAALIMVLVDGGIVLTFMDHRSVDVVYAAARAAGLETFNLLIWVKSNGGLGSNWRSRHETITASKKGGAPICNNIALGAKGRYRTNVLEYPGASSLGSEARDTLKSSHTPKPTALIADLIRDVSNVGDIVTDTFSGSGSVLISCELTGRRFRGCELDPLQVDVAVRRWQKMTSQDAVLASTGETFAEVEARLAASGEAEAHEGEYGEFAEATEGLQLAGGVAANGTAPCSRDGRLLLLSDRRTDKTHPTEGPPDTDNGAPTSDGEG